MALDVYTLFVCELSVLMFLIIVLLFAWRGAQYNPVLGINCLSLTATLLAIVFSSLRSQGYVFLPLVVGNLLMLFAYGILLCAFRYFRGARAGKLWMAGMAVWALLCPIPAFYQSMPLRVLVICVLCILYTAAMMRELWRARSLLPVTFWPAQLLLWIHLLFHVARILLDGGIPSPLHGAIGGSVFSVYVILESILMVIGMSVTLMAMVNERTLLRHKQAALLDPLTGVWNRRALFEKGEITPAGCVTPLSVMLLDLDHFKSINDRFGHNQGDKILIDFCCQVKSVLPPGGFFARLGGEEFATVLTLGERETMTFAESIRATVEHSTPGGVSYTVSIGVASCQPGHDHLDALLSAADEALYQAKTDGRNRVKAFTPALGAEMSIASSATG